MEKNEFAILDSIFKNDYSFLDKLISFNKFLYNTEIDFNDIINYIDKSTMSDNEKEVLKLSIEEHKSLCILGNSLPS
tara:strand:- start:239 stop:469 length:231 start_codon:yes stop_codon:yes gene_type:complete